MATRVWGAGSGAGTDGDWSTAANWTGDTAPVTGDIVIFDGTVVLSVTTGLNQSAVALNKLLIYPAYTGSVGLAGTPLQIDVNNGTLPRLMYKGGGSGILHVQGAITRAVVNTASSADPAFFLTTTGKTVTKLNLRKGKCKILGTGTITETNIGYVSTAASDVDLDVDGSSTLTRVYQNAGVAYLLSTATAAPVTLKITGGSFTQSGAGTITALDVHGSGSFTWSKNGQTITALRLFESATFDASAITQASTITDMFIHSPDVSVTLPSGGVLTITNGGTSYDEVSLLGDNTISEELID